MVAAEAQSPVRILTDFIAVVRAWAMEVVHIVAVMLVECTLPVMVVIICLVDLMLVVALTHQCILVVVWEAAVTWVVVVLDHTTDVVKIELFEMTKEAAVGCGLYGASRIRIPTILEGIKLLGLVASICYGRSFLT